MSNADSITLVCALLFAVGCVSGRVTSHILTHTHTRTCTHTHSHMDDSYIYCFEGVFDVFGSGVMPHDLYHTHAHKHTNTHTRILLNGVWRILFLHRCVFVVFFSGERSRVKIEKICDSFGTFSVYVCACACACVCMSIDTTLDL